MSSGSANQIWPLLLFMAVVFGLAVVMVIGGYILGERGVKKRGSNETFESGITPVGYGRFRISAQFYLVAMFFVLFDLETIFIIAWAVTYQKAGWTGYWELLTFVGELVVGLIYIWRIGALDWVPGRTREARRLARKTRSRA
jgi:NADH-quinone oxidoreductase subunit A